MSDEKRGAIIGAIGGGGATAGGTTGVLYDGDLLVGLSLAVATGCIFSGAAFLYYDQRTN